MRTDWWNLVDLLITSKWKYINERDFDPSVVAGSAPLPPNRKILLLVPPFTLIR